jgi:AraC-like DNA-binding protein
MGKIEFGTMVELNDDVAEIGPVPRRPPHPPRPGGRAGRKGRGLPRGEAGYAPEQAHRNLVKAMVACGATDGLIARLLHMDRRTLQRHFRAELKHGRAEVIAHMGATVVQKALNGDNDMLKFYLRTQAGWRDAGNLDTPSLPGQEHGAGLIPTLVIGFLENEDADAKQTIDGTAEAA